MRFSMATLLLVVVLVASYFPLKTLFEPWQQARIASKHPFYAHQINYSKLRDRDSVQSVSGIFPTLSFVKPNSHDWIRLQQSTTMTGEVIPNGADLYRYDACGCPGFLMFQNGELVLGDYDDDPAVVAQRRLITPSLWFRSGILPMYTLVASTLLALWAFLRWRYVPSNTNMTDSKQGVSITGT